MKCKLKCYKKPMKEPLSVSPGKGNQGTTRGKEKILFDLDGNQSTTSGLGLPLNHIFIVCRTLIHLAI